MGKGAKYFAKKRKKNMKNDNLLEDREIKNLEKKLKFSKKTKKNLPKAFVADGLDYLLDVCDEETRKIAAESDKRLMLQLDSESDEFHSDSNIPIKAKLTRKRKLIASKKNENDLNVKKHTQSFSESDFESDHDESYLCEKSDSNIRLKSKLNKKRKLTVNKKNENGSYVKKHTQSFSESDFELDDDESHLYEKSVSTTVKKTKKNPVQKNTKIQHGHKSNFELESDNDIVDEPNVKSIKPKKNKKQYENSKTKSNVAQAQNNGKLSCDFVDEESVNSTDEDNNERLDSSSDEANSNLSSSDDKKSKEVWEDIYGRKRNKDGTIVEENKGKYVTPALRSKFLQNNHEISEKLLVLRRQIKGLLNRLAESNMHAIVSQLDELYMSNSRNDMNEMITISILESIVTPTLMAERLVAEHMMCIVILHANIDTQVGANFILVLIKKFNEMIQQPQHVENKELDNLILMISYLYNFKVFGSQLIYQILDKLIEKFTEKEIEIILIILKTAGFRMRKDDPLALKALILNLQQKAAVVKSTNSRVQFMLEVLLAIKNNNMSKIPQYDQSHIEHLKKVLRSLIRKGSTISQLNLSLEDLLNADERGKWWIIGSAWSGKTIQNSELTKTVDVKPVYSQKILNLARAQRMNTDIRKNIFCILMTAEDYLDAFEKLHHLGLKDRQEREIIYVILNSCLQEQNFNPYYAVLLQKFCEYDRKYQMTIQYTLWDKLKMLDNYKSKQVMNMAKVMSYLFIQKALPLSILKVIQLGELDAITMKLFKKIMLDILCHENTETCLQVFEKIASSTQLHQFREGLRLFINYFLLKNTKKDTMPVKKKQLLEKRIQLVDKILTISTSKVSF